MTFAIFFVLANAFVCCMAKATMWATMDEAQIPIRLTGTAISMVTLVAIFLPDAVMPLINGWLLDTFAQDLPTAYKYYFYYPDHVVFGGGGGGIEFISATGGIKRT